MTLETFFEKFNLFADAPDAVAKMRELVLSLAVQGKLVDQITSDEPANKLLARLGLKSTVAIRGDAEIEGDSLPQSWARVRFEDIALVAGGVTLGRKLGERKTITLPYLRVANVKRGQIDLTVVKEVSIAEDEMDRYALRENDLLMTEGGDWDKVGRAAIWRAEIPVCLHQNHVFRARMRSAELTPSWFERYLNSRIGRSYFETASKQTTNLASINMRQVRNCPIPIPPLAEQKRIVAKVDELMALCGRLEAQQQERESQHAVLARAALARFADAPTPANLDFLFHKSYAISPADLRKSILTLAVQGKLVRFEVEIDEQTVGDHIDFLNGYAFKSQWFKPDGMRLCRNLNVSHGVIDWRESVFVDDDIAKEFERFALSEGDIVLSLDRPLITTGLKVARIRKSDLPCLLLQRVAKPVPKHDQLDMSYFMLWLNSSEFVDSIDPGRSNGVPHISTKQVQLLPFVLPPLAEQHRIVAKVDQLMALVDALESQLADSRAAAANLLSAMVAELTGTASGPKVSAQATSGTGRQGRPRKMA